MKLFISTLIATMTLSTYAQTGTRNIRHNDFRNTILELLNISSSKEVVFKRFSGVTQFQNRTVDCEIQIKSTATSTSLDLVFPTITRPQVSVEFAYNREIKEEIKLSSKKYSSFFTACNGDQYDTYRDCWEYDHYSITIKEVKNLITIEINRSSCTIKI